MRDYIIRALQLFPALGLRITALVFTSEIMLSAMSLVIEYASTQSPWEYVFLKVNFSVLTFLFGIFVECIVLLFIRSYAVGEEILFFDAVREAARLWPTLVRAWFMPMLKIIMGSFLFVVPGIYLHLKYYFISHEIIFNCTPPGDAAKLSERLTLGYRLTLFSLEFLLLFLPSLAVFTATLALNDFSMAAMAETSSVHYAAETVFWCILHAVSGAIIYISTTLIFLESLALRPHQLHTEAQLPDIPPATF